MTDDQQVFELAVCLDPGLLQADEACLVEIRCQSGLGLYIQITGVDLVHGIFIETCELGTLLLQLPGQGVDPALHRDDAGGHGKIMNIPVNKGFPEPSKGTPDPSRTSLFCV